MRQHSPEPRWRRYYDRNRRIIADHLSNVWGDHCASIDECAETAIEWHHVRPETRLFKIAQTGPRGVAALLRELQKCVPLCSRHHRQIHVDLDLNRKPDDGRKCERCQRSMQGTRSHARFCSRKCQDCAKQKRARQRRRDR